MAKHNNNRLSFSTMISCWCSICVGLTCRSQKKNSRSCKACVCSSYIQTLSHSQVILLCNKDKVNSLCFDWHREFRWNCLVLIPQYFPMWTTYTQTEHQLIREWVKAQSSCSSFMSVLTNALTRVSYPLKRKSFFGPSQLQELYLK